MVESGGKLEGLKELDAKMQQLIKSVEADKVEPILKEGGEMIVDAGRPVTPYDPKRKKGKHLREAWVTKLMPRRRNKNPAPCIAAIDHKIAPHASLVEKGTSRMAAKPYFRPTWDKMKRTVKKHIIDRLKDNIDQAVK